MIEKSQNLVEEGLRSVPDHRGLLMFRDTLRTQLQHRWKLADQFLLQAHANLRRGALEDSLQLIEEGLKQVPSHPELLTLREGVQAEISQRQRVAQLLAQARELRGQNALDESLQRIEEGLRLAPDQPDLQNMRDRVKAALQTHNVTQMLRDCANRYRLDRLSAQTGGEAVECYTKIIKLAPNNSEARAMLEQLAERYADWASDAIHQADFQLAEDCLAQLGKIKPNHPLFATLSQALQAKREQVAVEVKRKAVEDDARRQAAEEAKRQAAAVRRQAAEEAKRRTEEQANKPSASPILKPEIAQPSKQSRPGSERTDETRHNRSKSTNCSEVLLKAQLGEPLSSTEREECK